MSFDLIVWKAPLVTDPDDADRLLERFHDDGDLDAFERSDDLLRFHDELLQSYPALESFADPDDDAAYWSMTPERSDSVIEMNMQWRVPDRMLDDIVRLAAKHNLVLYDPQGPQVHLPSTARPQVERGVLWGSVTIAFALLVLLASLFTAPAMARVATAATGTVILAVGVAVYVRARRKGRASGR